MKKLILFDLDGTLIDSAEDVATALNQVLFFHKGVSVTVDQVKQTMGLGPRHLLYAQFPDLVMGSDFQKKIESEFLAAYWNCCTEKTTLFPFAAEFLNSWSGAKGVITNKNKDLAAKIMNHLGFPETSWDCFYGGDSFAEKKPSPYPLHQALKSLKINPQDALMIGDGLPDIIAANQIPMDCLIVGFGYTPLELIKPHRPQGILHSYKDLHSLIASLNAKPFPSIQ